jgi:hypothetical protein
LHQQAISYETSAYETGLAQPHQNLKPFPFFAKNFRKFFGQQTFVHENFASTAKKKTERIEEKQKNISEV